MGKRSKKRTDFMKLSIKEQNQSKTVKFISDAVSGITVCRLFDRWLGIWYTGRTRCHDVDAFNEEKGRKIAFNKARKKELMHNLTMINNEREAITEEYKAIMKRLDKREDINNIYLAGVEDELAELFGIDNHPAEVETTEPSNDVETTEPSK